MTERAGGYWQTEAEFPELRDLSTFSADWYRKWRELHLGKYPDADVSTRANLDMFVTLAEAEEVPTSGEGCTHPEHDVPRCDVHGTPLERLTHTHATLGTIASWWCSFCNTEAVYGNGCDHPSMNGVDQAEGPDKMWRCASCGWEGTRP